MIDAYHLTHADWENYLAQRGMSPFILRDLLRSLYKGDTSRSLSPGHLENIRADFHTDLPSVTRSMTSEDGTVKFQVRFRDGIETETVLLPFHKRYTVCLSSQVGCAMNCSFCYTGTQGLKRHLTAGEIVAQYLVAARLAPKGPRPSIVFMGQGEPLHNFQEVRRALEILTHPQLGGVGPRQITLSTVGFIPGLERWSLLPPVNFALSLHSPFQEERTRLIPLSERYPLSEVLNVIDRLPRLKRQFLTFEYLLIEGLNMSERHVEGLNEILSPRPHLLNLIPFNPYPGSQWRRPSKESVDEFRMKLVARHIRVMVRGTKGDDILAACGQLKLNHLARAHEHA